MDMPDGDLVTLVPYAGDLHLETGAHGADDPEISFNSAI